MSYTITPAENSKYVRITVEADLTIELAREYLFDAHQLGRELGTNCYLLDVTRAPSAETALNSYRFNRDGLEDIPGFDLKRSVAVLLAPGDRSHDFYVAVAQSAGDDITVFHDEAEAIAHLETRADQPSS